MHNKENGAMGNGVSRMLGWYVNAAAKRCKSAIKNLGAGTFLDEDQTALLLGCTLKELNNMRVWKRIDLGFYVRSEKPSEHYENNNLEYHYKLVNTTYPFQVTPPLQALAVHDISRVIGSDTRRVANAVICDGLAQMDDRPWAQWLPKRTGLGVRALSTKGLPSLLKGSGINPDRVKQRRELNERYGKESNYYRGLTQDDLRPVLERYPNPPKIDLTEYTRVPYHVPITNGTRQGGTITYKLSDIKKFLDDPWPYKIDRLGRSNKEVIYCIASEGWKDGLVKIGYVDNREIVAQRMIDYRSDSVFPGSPIVHWAVECARRPVLEKRLHNLYLPRQWNSVGPGKCGGEMFWGSPKRWSPERMLKAAVNILEETESKYTVLDVHPITYKVRRAA